MELEQEAERLEQLIAGKTVRLVRRFRPAEILIEFTDGTRLYVHAPSDPIECSITGVN
jgi:hypothetical protein